MLNARVPAERRPHIGAFVSMAAVLVLITGSSSARANTLFTENFNSYTGNQNANQVDTGSLVAFGGTVSGWTGAGGNALHAVEVAPSDWTVMFYGNNSITLDTGIAANDVSMSYMLSFDYGTGNYAAEAQGTNALDGIVVELLRSDNSVLAQQTYLPGAWGPGNYDLNAGLQGTLTYTGDGSGDVRIEILTSMPSNPIFGGSIDNIVLSGTPEPAGFVLAGPGLALLGWGVFRRRRVQAS
jgi:hypothetical protein